MELRAIFSAIRGVTRDSFTFNDIKEIAGASGLPVHKLSHLQQRSLPARSASKSALLDAIDGLLNEQQDPNRAIKFFIQEMLRRHDRIADRINAVVEKFGWQIQNGDICPTDLHFDETTVDYKQEIQDAIGICMQRYRDADYAGAITSVCGAVDLMTEHVYAIKGIANVHRDSYQQRVNKAFKSFEKEYKDELHVIEAIDEDELTRIWKNHRSAVNQAAFILGSYRRNISDAHGPNECPKEFVQKALDCGTFILRSILPYIDSP
ncbi:MAG: hypothetical protein ACYS21_00775 [Planctomycetota bacterium]